MKRALVIGDKVTFREEAFAGLCKQVPWLVGMSWSDWDKSGVPLAIDDERPRISMSERRLFSVRTEDGRRCCVWPSDIKLDDRERRKRIHDQIWAEKLRERVARQKRIKGRKKP